MSICIQREINGKNILSMSKFSWSMLLTYDPFYKHDLILIPARVSTYMPRKVYDEITNPFLNSNSCTVEV